MFEVGGHYRFHICDHADDGITQMNGTVIEVNGNLITVSFHGEHDTIMNTSAPQFVRAEKTEPPDPKKMAEFEAFVAGIPKK